MTAGEMTERLTVNDFPVRVFVDGEMRDVFDVSLEFDGRAWSQVIIVEPKSHA